MNRKLPIDEVAAALGIAALPTIMTPEEVPRWLRVKVSPLYCRVSEGRLGSAVRQTNVRTSPRYATRCLLHRPHANTDCSAVKKHGLTKGIASLEQEHR
jgi:hypothetical protein